MDGRTEPLSLWSALVMGRRVGFPFSLNHHFVASMSPSLKLSLLEDKHGRTSVPTIPPTCPRLSRQTAQPSQSEQAGPARADGRSEGAPFQTVVTQTKQEYVGFHTWRHRKWKRGSVCRQLTMSSSGWLGVSAWLQMEPHTLTSLDRVGDGSKARWMVMGRD